MPTIGILFGGVSVEHEVSVISAMQVAAALDRGRYRPVPIYVAKSGLWYTGEHLLEISTYKDLKAAIDAAVQVTLVPDSAMKTRLQQVEPPGWFSRPLHIGIDVVFLAFHGGEGENGGFQGLCETLNVPYTGSGVFGSASGIDKVLSKMMCRDQEIPIVDFLWFRESDWADREEEWLDRCERALGYPAVVKPARLGSSIGISRASDRQSLDTAIETAFRFDEKVVIERAVRRLREINCAVLGDPEQARASVLEEPVPSDEESLLSFQDKYERGGESDKSGPRNSSKDGASRAGMASLDRIIPADLPEERTKQIQELAVRVFQLFECSGVARIDFMIDEATDDVYFNEINTIPGSFSFYMWEPSGLPFDALAHEMIEIAVRRHRQKNSRVRSYDTNLLSARSMQGLKAAKG